MFCFCRICSGCDGTLWLRDGCAVIVRSFDGYPYKDVGLLDQLLPVGVLLSFFVPILLVPYYAILTYLRIKNRRAEVVTDSR